MTEPLAPAAAPNPTRKSRWFAIAIKGAVTAVVLAVLISRAGWSAMAAQVKGVSQPWIAAGLAAKALSLLFAAERWRMAIAAAGSRVTFSAALRALVIGLFFGQVLPGTMGGDVVRGWLTYKADCPPATVILAFVIDRALALLACLLLLLAGVGFLPPAIAGAVIALLLALGVGLSLLLCADRFRLPARLGRFVPLIVQLRRALVSLRAATGLGAGIAVHLCTIAAAFGFAAALHVPATLADLLVVVPVAIFVTALPISLNGWGAREGAFVAGLALYNIGSGEALILSLMMGFSDMLVSLPGAALWLLTDNRPAAAPPVPPVPMYDVRS